MDFNIDKLFLSPEFYPLSIDFYSGTVTFVHLTRKRFIELPFHDHPNLENESKAFNVKLDDLLALYKRQTPPQRSVNFIFHTAFCGSTLLGKYLENPGWTFVYREPAILTSLALLRFEPASYTDQWQDIFELMLALLSRTNSCNEVPIIKLHDGCSCIIDNLLSMNPDSKGLILYSDWHSFLVSILTMVRTKLSCDIAIIDEILVFV